MSDTYLKAILVSAVGGLYMIAYSLYFIGDQLSYLKIDKSNFLVDLNKGNTKWHFRLSIS